MRSKLTTTPPAIGTLAPVVVGAASTCGDRQPVLPTQFHQRDDLFGRGRERHGVGQGLLARIVVAIGQPLGRIEQQTVRAQHGGQFTLQIGGQDRHAASVINRRRHRG
jgi:hypothetical protein